MEHIKLGDQVRLIRPNGVRGTVVGTGHVQSTNGHLLEVFVIDIGESRAVEGLEGMLTVSKIVAMPDTIFKEASHG